MKDRCYLIIIICQIFFLAILSTHEVEAQEQGGWSPLHQLSINKGKAGEAAVVADQFGYVHVFWTEELEDQRIVILYARFEGVTWSMPIDIRITQPFRSIGNISPIVDQNGTLHVVWSESSSGPAFYTSAPAYDATSAQNWQQPLLLKVPADRIYLEVDGKDFLHILYVKFLGQEQGLYYMRSEDKGANWSKPVWLDPDILFDNVPKDVNFEMDESGGLHAAWYYTPRTDLGGDWVRYIHSADGGNSWSRPFTIDRLDQATVNNGIQLSAAGPIMAVQGQNVLIIWAGGKLHYRNYRFSTDAGETWSEPTRFWGELNGQAGDGIAVDSANRIHYFTQVRFPKGIYHVIWENGQWHRPELIYLIQYGSEDQVSNQIEAHGTNPAIRAGNQLLLAFADPPPEVDRKLFFMTYSLDDIAPMETALIPTPQLTLTVVLSPTLTSQSTPMATPRSLIDSTIVGVVPSPGNTLWSGLLPTLLLIGVMILFRLLRSRY
jgi:hypothetical protein